MKKRLLKILYYSVPVFIAAVIIFLQLFGLPEIWKALSIPAVLLLGSFLLDHGKIWGSIFGLLFGIGSIWAGIDKIVNDVFSHILLEIPVGVFMTAYYLFCAFCAWMIKRKTKEK